MIEFTRLHETAERLVKRLETGGLPALDQVLNASTRTAATYRYTYDRFLRYFRDKPAKQPLDEQDLFVGFALAYSWMATIKQLDPTIDTVRAATSALNRLRDLRITVEAATPEDQTAVLTEWATQLLPEIEPVRQFLGSVVGTSRLLHFANPETFPMWDAVIHRYCDKALTRQTLDSLSRYIEYTANVHRVVGHADFDRLIYEPVSRALTQAYQAVSDQYPTPNIMGTIRTAEFVMFYGGKAEHLAEQEQHRAERGEG